MKIRLLLTLSFLCHLFIYAQTGPGGIGADDGSSNLVLWLRADREVEEAALDFAEDGDAVSIWRDQSGYNNDAIDGATPEYQTAEHNGMPAVNFNGIDSQFDLTAGLLPTGNVARTYISVAEGSPTTGQALLSYGGVGPGSKIGISHRSDLSAVAVAGHNWGTAGAFTTALRLQSVTFPTGSSTSDQFAITINGADVVESSIAGANKIVNTGSISAFLGSNFNQTIFFDGDMTEIIAFDKELNNAEIIIVYNYLAAKYGISLDADDLYNEDDGGAGNYDHDVAGIGRVDASNEHTDSKGTGIVRILNASDLDDDEFYIWGHDNGILEGTEYFDIPPSVEARLVRVWRGSEVNTSGSAVDVGSVDVRWDLNGLGPVVTSELRMLIDTDNDGVFTDEIAISGATSLGGGIYVFAGITGLEDNLRFTLASTNHITTPLPVELLYFTAVPDGRNVLLNWETHSELNNSHFEIERSLDTEIWENIDFVEGAGNSSEILHYSTIDDKPYLGVSYYRLKQVDFDGIYTYSPVRVVEFTGFEIADLYPNPSNGQFTIGINSSVNAVSDFIVYNVLGEVVYKQSLKLTIGLENYLIDLSELASGAYHIYIDTHKEMLNDHIQIQIK